MANIIKANKKIGRICIFCLVAVFLIQIFATAKLTSVNFKVEELKTTIRTQEKKNQSLVMKVNELASLDNIKEVATTEGLAYNNTNIKVVTKE